MQTQLDSAFHQWGGGMRLLIGLFVSLIVGGIVVYFIMDKLLWPKFKEEFPDGITNYPKGQLTLIILGAFERLLYTLALVVGAWQWVGVWMGIKTAVHWEGWKNDKYRSFNLFLTGNAINIFFGLIGAWVVLGRFSVAQ